MSPEIQQVKVWGNNRLLKGGAKQNCEKRLLYQKSFLSYVPWDKYLKLLGNASCNTQKMLSEVIYKKKMLLKKINFFFCFFLSLNFHLSIYCKKHLPNFLSSHTKKIEGDRFSVISSYSQLQFAPPTRNPLQSWTLKGHI